MIANSEIREATIDDFQQILLLYRQLHPNDQPAEPVTTEKTIMQILNTDYFKLIVAVLNAQIVATCYLNLIPNLTRGSRPYAIIENVITDAKHRNKGIGKALVKHAIEIAFSHNCYKIMLQTGSKRESIHRFYRSCGFSTDIKKAFTIKNDI